ncbi:Trk system potassium transporter TrkA [Blastopirellula marina]|uniref:Trk system potassium uptake protein TrkA n=1 Tax=Blastopirellula marina TaxID=124 RepID=A0A2S8FNX3_9BACT|nr:Trk system potassium transporter TrkA [Blastopirellula marina]PQO33871.1 Trk system potassium transporter TrkA [Blastopirellula marina]PTL43658.1 Trk system potassium transporter TrkA [Blastopirellula marina]
MRIVILGAGTVGTWIADLLCRNNHSVTVVENNSDHVRAINAELDVRAIHGSASESAILFQAGIIGCDLCLALTGDDEVNIVAASMAKAMGARRAVARVYGRVFRDLSTFDYQRHFRIDRFLSLEHLSAVEFVRAIRSPGSAVLENFARGELEVQEIICDDSAPAIGKPLKEVGLPKGVRVGTIQRQGKTWIAGAGDSIQLGDHITLIGTREEIDNVKAKFEVKATPVRSVVIAGGGETGLALARMLEGQRYNVTLMEENMERCEFLARLLEHTTVVRADATRKAILEEERVGRSDVFVACTGDDENNIMSCVEAREIGAPECMAIVQRPDYANVVEKLGINLAVSPRNVVARQVLGLLNSGPIISKKNLPGGGIAIVEFEVMAGVKATQHVIANLKLPAHCLIAAIMSSDYVRVASADDRLTPGDTVVVLVDEASLDPVVKLFDETS